LGGGPRLNTGKTVFAQITQLVHCYEFNKCVHRYQGNLGERSFPCWSQFVCMTYAQLTGRTSLRDIETCLNAPSRKVFHMGFRGPIARSNLADANEHRDFGIYAGFATHLIQRARAPYQGEELAVNLDKSSSSSNA